MEILPFNKAAGSKYALIRERYALAGTAAPSEDDLERTAARFREVGIPTSMKR